MGVSMARIYLVEPGKTGGPGALGARIVQSVLNDAGHVCTHMRLVAPKKDQPVQLSLLLGTRADRVAGSSLARPDAWFVSVLHVEQWQDLPHLFDAMGMALFAADRKESDPLVVFGGQSMLYPAPIMPFADLLAHGDGEVTANAIASMLDAGADRLTVARELHGQNGFYSPIYATTGDRLMRAEQEFRPRLVYVGNKAKRPTIEIARGCASKCAFCSIGWTGGSYREASHADIKSALSTLHSGVVNLTAPDYGSVRDVEQLEDLLSSHGCRNRGANERLDATQRLLARGGAQKGSHAFGIEGMAERLRAAIGKPISRERLVDTMASLRGCTRMKWYVINALPGECDEDVDEIWADVQAVRDAWGSARNEVNTSWVITCTHFQSLPHTPLQRFPNGYDDASRDRVLELTARCKAKIVSGEHAPLISTPRSPERHDLWVYLRRSGAEASRFLEQAARLPAAHFKDGRWRSLWEKVCRPASDLSGRLDGDLPWGFVDSGMDEATVDAAESAYIKRARRAEDKEGSQDD